MSNLIIATAGHIDHGKTALIKKLTGINTDTLKEEKLRGITVDLGFADLSLPSGKKASIIDVPGHERFIKNMVAGVSSVDLILFVVAGDEGMMPQSIEHLQILEGLSIKNGVIVVTKIDKVEDELYKIVEEDIRETVRGSFLENSQIIKTSTITDEGITELKDFIDNTSINQIITNNDIFRMCVDRVFTIKGVGTIVTGTSLEGSIKEGDEIYIFPNGTRGRVRGIQTHGNIISCNNGRNRLAINISGVNKEEISRGDIIYGVENLMGSNKLECSFNRAFSSNVKLKNRDRVRFYHGTREVMGRVVLIDENINYIKLLLEEEVFTLKGDSYFLRNYSPMYNLGGGKIINTQGKKGNKYTTEEIEAIIISEKGTLEERVLEFLGKQEWILVKDVEEEFECDISQLIEELIERELIFSSSSKEVLIINKVFKEKADYLVELIKEFHNKNNLSRGISTEELRKRVFKKEMKKGDFNEILYSLVSKNVIEVGNGIANIKGYKRKLKKYQENFKEKLIKVISKSEINVDEYEELCKSNRLKGDESKLILEFMKNEGVIIELSDGILIYKNSYDEAIKVITEFMKNNNGAALGEIRDLINRNRKTTLAILEEMDKNGLTKRIENRRILN